jgi:hypothetical protein
VSLIIGHSKVVVIPVVIVVVCCGFGFFGDFFDETGTARAASEFLK